MSLSEFQSRIAVIISADGQGAIKEIQKVGQAADRDLGKATQSIDKLGNRLTYGGAAAMGFAALAGGALYSFAKAADEAHQSEIKLQNSMQNSPALANTNIKVFKDLAQAIQGKTAADGDEVLGSMAVLAQFRLTEQQIKTVTPLVVDYARKMGVDLDTAAKNVGKALNGKATALQKTGIKIDENVYKTDRLRAVTDGLRSTVGGFAEQEGQTFSGKLERLKNQMNDLKESIGSGVISTVGPLLNSFGKVAQGASEVNDKTGGMVGTIASVGVGVIALGGAVSFLSGQFIKLRAQMIGAEGGLSAFGAASMGIGAIGIATVIGAGIDKLQHSMDNLNVNIRTMHDEMASFASSGAVSGGLKKTIDDTTTLGHQIRMVGDSSYQAAHSMSMNIVSINGTLGNAINIIKGMPSTFGDAMSNMAKGKFEFFDAMNLWSSSAEESKKKIKSLDQSLADMVASGRADAAARLFDQMSESAKKGGASQKDINNSFKEYLGSAQAMSAATAEQTRNYEEFGGSIRFVDMALMDQLELQDKLSSGNRSLEESMIRIGDQMRDYIKTQKDASQTDDQRRLSNLQLQDSIGEVVKKAEDLAAAQNKDATATVQAQAKQDAQRAALEALRVKYPELSSVIDEYIRKLIMTPREIETKVTVNTDIATAQLRLWERNQGGEIAYYLAQKLPGRAAGGPVMAGQAYIVGERGPELMVPNANGSVIPNSALRAYNPPSGGVYNINVSVAAGAHPADVGAHIVNAIKAYERSNGSTWRGAA